MKVGLNPDEIRERAKILAETVGRCGFNADDIRRAAKQIGLSFKKYQSSGLFPGKIEPKQD